MMLPKILSPIDNVEEAQKLIEIGVDEFYCGLFLDNKNYNSSRIGVVARENLGSEDQLRQLIKIIKRAKRKIFLVFNQQNISKNDCIQIKKNILKLSKYKIDGFIVGNIDLLYYLRNQKINLIASSFLEAKNYEAVSFLVSLGAKRIILDRQISLDDVEIIRKNDSYVELEAFVMEVGCMSLDGYCGREGLDIKGYNHICMNNYKIVSDLKVKKCTILEKRLRMPEKMCGACALWDFKKNKINSVKIVGRGFDTKRKIENAKFLVEARSKLNESISRLDFSEKVQKIFCTIYKKKCNQKMCYYPHFFKIEK